MKVFTSYFGNISALKNEGIECFSIARYSPRWYTGHRLTWLAPTSYMLSDNCSREEYIKMYKEICNRVNVESLMKQLEKIGNGADVALLCYERPGDFCHRHLLAEHLNSKGCDIKEFSATAYRAEKQSQIVEQEEQQTPEQLSLFD